MQKKYSSYSFDERDYPRITVQLLVEVIAYQHALTDAVLGEINDEAKADRIVNRINDLMLDKKETILEQLYASFGKTPEVGPL
ncbi:MAG: hypothetical protein Q8918_18170 [Bacteroidota bacterium]|nr:hypothetical protein [Bacteroidota bacterium]